MCFTNILVLYKEGPGVCQRAQLSQTPFLLSPHHTGGSCPWAPQVPLQQPAVHSPPDPSDFFSAWADFSHPQSFCMAHPTLLPAQCAHLLCSVLAAAQWSVSLRGHREHFDVLLSPFLWTPGLLSALSLLFPDPYRDWIFRGRGAWGRTVRSMETVKRKPEVALLVDAHVPQSGAFPGRAGVGSGCDRSVCDPHQLYHLPLSTWLLRNKGQLQNSCQGAKKNEASLLLNLGLRQSPAKIFSCPHRLLPTGGNYYTHPMVKSHSAFGPLPPDAA